MLKTIVIFTLSLMFLVSLAACDSKSTSNESLSEPSISTNAISSETTASESIQPDAPAYDVVAFPFYDDQEFLQEAYAMGYTDRLLQTLWEGGYTKQSLLESQLDYVYDTSPDEKNILYTASNMGSVMFISEPICVKNNDTGKITVLDTDGNMSYINKYFASNDSVGIFDSNGGSLYNLKGEKLLWVTLVPEASGYFIYMPVYNPKNNNILGLGIDYKTGNSINMGVYEQRIDGTTPILEEFALVEAALDGKVFNTAYTDIPMELNRYNQIIYPDGAYVRDGYLWISLVTLDGNYLFYRIEMEPSYQIELVSSSEFRAVFPNYDRKG